MNLYDFLCRARQVTDILKDLARRQVLTLERGSDGSEFFHLHLHHDRLTQADRAFFASAPGFRPPAGLPIESAVECYVTGRLLLDGPRMFRPTVAECQALEEIEVSVPMQDYEQPFPTFVVEFPAGYGQVKLVEGADYLGRVSPYRPVACVLRHERDLGMVLTTTLTDHSRGLVLTGTFGADPSAPVENDLSKLMSDEGSLNTAEQDLLRRTTRVAMNACLLLMANGFRRAGYACNVTRLLRRDSAHDRRELALVPEVYAFEQAVDVRRQVGSAEAGIAGAGGWTVSPHWRRSHWRMQPYGPGHSLRRRQLIPHCFVGKDRFRGPDSATSWVGQ